MVHGLALSTTLHGKIAEETVDCAVVSTEAETSFAGEPISIFRSPGSSSDKSDFYIVIGKDENSMISLEPSGGNAPEWTPTPIADLSLARAIARERAQAAASAQEAACVGLGVSRVAQDLFNLFHKQLPRDTKWFSPGQSQDLLVLGVRIRYPYSQPNACEVSEPEGGKSLARIASMTAKYMSEMQNQDDEGN